MSLRLRRAARLVVIDPSARILLVRYAPRAGDEFWALPGGGLDAGETFADAAAREALEELGIEGATFRRLWTDVVGLPSGNRQEERYFAVGGGVIDLEKSAGGRSEEGITAVRWWSVAEIESASVPVFPSGLTARLSGFDLISSKPRGVKPDDGHGGGCRQQ